MSFMRCDFSCNPWIQHPPSSLYPVYSSRSFMPWFQSPFAFTRSCCNSQSIISQGVSFAQAWSDAPISFIDLSKQISTPVGTLVLSVIGVLVLALLSISLVLVGSHLHLIFVSCLHWVNDFSGWSHSLISVL